MSRKTSKQNHNKVYASASCLYPAKNVGDHAGDHITLDKCLPALPLGRPSRLASTHHSTIITAQAQLYSTVQEQISCNYLKDQSCTVWMKTNRVRQHFSYNKYPRVMNYCDLYDSNLQDNNLLTYYGHDTDQNRAIEPENERKLSIVVEDAGLILRSKGWTTTHNAPVVVLQLFQIGILKTIR